MRASRLDPWLAELLQDHEPAEVAARIRDRFDLSDRESDVAIQRLIGLRNLPTRSKLIR